jgi:hypothetical protein
VPCPHGFAQGGVYCPVVAQALQVGHKESLGLQGILRKTCRDLLVPFLDLHLDIFDKRYTTPGEVRAQFSEFFQSMDLG